MNVLKLGYLPTVFGNVLSNMFIITTVLSQINLANGAVPMTAFFPYLKLDNTTLTPYVADVQLGFSFPYFGVNYTRIVVAEQGYVHLGENFHMTRSLHCQILRVVYPGILPLNSLIELDKDGSITYGTCQNRTLLDKLSNDVLEYFALDVSLTNCFVVSYINVKNTVAPKRSTFQMLMFTDGVHSFVIFHYNQVSDFSRGGLFAVGFTDHNQLTHLLYDWCRDKEGKYNLDESNVSVPGKWAFRVDSNTLLSPLSVNFHQKANNKPRIVNLAGRRYLLTEIEYIGNIACSDMALVCVTCFYGNLPQKPTEGTMLPEFSGIICKLSSEVDTGYAEARMEIRLKVKTAILTRTVNASIYLPEPTTTEPVTVIPAFGNTPLLIRNTSLISAPVKIICTFFELSNIFKRSEGMVLLTNESLIMCPVPFLTTFGKINLEIQLVYENDNTEILSGYFYAQRESDCNSEIFASIQLKEENGDLITLQVSMNSTWKNNFLKPEIAQYFKENSTFKELVVYGYDGTDWNNGIVIASSSQNGTFKIALSEEVLVELFDKNLVPAFGIKETLVTNSGQNIAGVTFLKLNESSWLLQNLKNLSGYINLNSHFATQCQDALKNEQCYISTISIPCPETLKQAKSDWMFIEDNPVQIHDERLKSFTNAVPSRSGDGIQCLYSTNGILSSFSHKQHHSSTFWRNQWSHYKNDFVPFMYCCGLNLASGNCDNFVLSERRYKGNGNYSFPRFVLAVSTGKIFPFQGMIIRVESVGEFWALKYNNQNEITQFKKSSYESFKIQFRVEEYINLKGESKGVPVITTVAIVDRDNHNNFAMQISRDKNQLSVQVNEREPYFIIPISKIADESREHHTLYFDQATIKHMPSLGQLLATFKSGFSVKLYLAGDNEMGLSFIVSASESRFQNSVGLLAGSTVQDTETVNAWKVHETDTIFLYTVENPWSAYQRSDVSLRVPSLLNLQVGETVNPGLEGIMDFLATGSESIGNSTRMIHEEFSFLKTAFQT